MKSHIISYWRDRRFSAPVERGPSRRVAQPVPANVVIIGEGGGGIQPPINDRQPQTRAPDIVPVYVVFRRIQVWCGQDRRCLPSAWNFLVSTSKHGDGALI